MPYFCISDLHLGDGGSRDNFNCDASRKYRIDDFMRHVYMQNGKIIILGDLFEWWQTNLSATIRHNKSLLNKLTNQLYSYVIGNHDSAFKFLINNRDFSQIHRIFNYMSHAFAMEIGGRRFLFMHGHEVDSYCNSDNPGVGEITAIVSGLLEDRNESPSKDGKFIEDKFLGVLEKISSRYRMITRQSDRTPEMIAGVEKRRALFDADVVVYGHTHIPGNVRDFHYNAGCWSGDVDTYVKIDDDGTAKVCEWTKESKEAEYIRELR